MVVTVEIRMETLMEEIWEMQTETKMVIIPEIRMEI
jgi:hypothetical protein